MKVVQLNIYASYNRLT